MNLEYVLARRFEPIHQSYDWRDSALLRLVSAWAMIRWTKTS